MACILLRIGSNTAQPEQFAHPYIQPNMKTSLQQPLSLGRKYTSRTSSRLHALACSLALGGCVMASRPFAEMGIEDDWSYARTTEILAQTGHVVYNGWATAMLGWQLYWGALFVKLFGFSFCTLRWSILVLGMLTIFLFHRCLVRCGLSERNAALGTLTLALSPLSFALSFTFMTDMTGLLCIVVALYACLRALQSNSEASSIAWLAGATGAGLAGGTARQIAWLSALIMVPSAAWLLRHRRGVMAAGWVFFGASLIFVIGSLQWFNRQPFTIPEKLLAAPLTLTNASFLLVGFTRLILGLPLFLLPLLIPFIALFPWESRRARMGCVSLGIFFALVGLLQFHRHKLYVWLTPYTQNFVTSRGVIDVPIIVGLRPVVLHTGLRILLTLLTFAAALSFVVFLLRRYSPIRQGVPMWKRFMPRKDNGSGQRVSWRSLAILLGPFTLAYLLLLVPRAAVHGMNDRYLLPIIAICILVVTRVFQESVPTHLAPRLCALSFLSVGLIAMYGVAAMHDLFALYRARIAAIDEPLRRGVPRWEIGGGFEFDDWTELEIAGHVNDSRIENPIDAYKAPAVVRGTQPCNNEKADLVPHVVPRYILSFDPDACAGRSQFAPVVYRNWLLSKPVTIYVLEAPR
jgi:hypothetical protein